MRIGLLFANIFGLKSFAQWMSVLWGSSSEDSVFLLLRQFYFLFLRYFEGLDDFLFPLDSWVKDEARGTYISGEILFSIIALRLEAFS